jgi:hypothetical protein
MGVCVVSWRVCRRYAFLYTVKVWVHEELLGRIRSDTEDCRLWSKLDCCPDNFYVTTGDPSDRAVWGVGLDRLDAETVGSDPLNA